MNTPTYEEILAGRAAKGAAFLDLIEPGWAARIAVDALAMHTCDACILGQLHGDYAEGWAYVVGQFDGPWQFFSAAAHGFTLPEAEQAEAAARGEPYAPFLLLGAAWRPEIARRVAA